MTRRFPACGPMASAAICVFCCLGLAASTPAQSSDQVGIYFGDPALGIYEGQAETFPAFDTAAIVLLNPSLPDIGGWELRVAIDGPAVVAGWQLTGQTVNFLNPPEFLVGLAAPLPAAPQVVLAQGPLVVTGPERVVMSLHPTYVPSLPGEMAYIPFEDKEPLTPLTTSSGAPAVAFYNTQLPLCDVSASTLDFGTQFYATRTSLEVTVANVGGGYLPVDAALNDPCGAFRIVSGGGPALLGWEDQLVVTVEFEPPAVGEYQCVLDLGIDCGSVELVGAGRDGLARISFSQSAVDFGDVRTDRFASASVWAENTGETVLVVVPTLPDSCAGFQLHSDFAAALDPGDRITLDITFAPPAAGAYSCAVVLGPGLATLPLSGQGILAPESPLVIEPPAVDFGTVLTGTDNQQTVTITNGGAEPTVVLPTLNSPCPSYTIWPLDQAVTLGAGEAWSLQIHFAPETPGIFNCLVSLGDEHRTIPVSGTGMIHGGGLRLQPAALDFGGVAVGSWSERSVTAINETLSPITLVPWVGDSSTGFSMTGSAVSVVLSPGGRHTFSLKFQPEVLGPYTGELSFGDGLATAPLGGVGEEEATGWLVEPESVDFGTVYARSPAVERSVYVTNTGNVNTQAVFNIPDVDGQFRLVDWMPAWIGPGEYHRVRIEFEPDAAGFFANELAIAGIGTVPLSGTGVTDVPHCFVHPTNLEFGTVLTGMTAVATVYVTNSGGEPLAVAPTTDRTDFLYTGDPFELATGETAPVEIAFNPTAAGEQICILDLGPDFCSRVVMFGEGSDSLVPDHDLVGIWFDPELSVGIRSDADVGEAVPAWLALINPSESGLGGWELRLDLDAGLHLAGYEITGDHYNFEAPPSFFVGLGSPLPDGPQIVLATFAFLVTDTDVHPVDVLPVWRPSIPDHLAYVHGEDLQLKKMFPVSGVPSVAWLSAGTSVAVVAPAPAARLDGGRIELRWPLPRADSDGCHVYRAVAGAESRLTRSPLQPSGGSYVFVDDPTGLTAGATVAYSYAVMRGGTEIARSPAAAVRLPGATVFATRLLPNRPNPFNPETEIRYEVARTGPVRLAVYDLTGRRVAVLEDAVRDAGPHQVTWRGRDDAGRALPSGAYYLRLETVTGRDARKIMLLK